jgi:hypothetical protein
MQIGRLVRPLAHSMAAVLMLSAASLATAQSHDDHPGMVASQPHKPTPLENELVQTVRAATEKFKDVTNVAGPGPDYALTFGCVSGGDFGAMGLHYLKGSILHDGEIDKNDPEIILFEPTRNGGIRITGADYLVFVSEWEQKHKGEGPPSIDGQFFHLFDAPNRFGLDPFYTLHVWAWKENPVGTFANWNPNVSCDGFNPR